MGTVTVYAENRVNAERTLRSLNFLVNIYIYYEKKRAKKKETDFISFFQSIEEKMIDLFIYIGLYDL